MSHGSSTRRTDELVIDELTKTCLDLARRPDESRRIHLGLQAFFRDIRHRLNQHKLGLYVARRSQAPPSEAVWSGLERSYSSIERLVERFEGVCRPTEVSPLACDLDLLLSDRRTAWNAEFARSRGEIRWETPLTPVVARFDPVRLMKALDAFVAWRSAEVPPESRVRVAWWRSDDRVHLVWEESSEIPPTALDNSSEDISLALPVLASVVSAHGGELSVGHRDGVLVEISWPGACLTS